MRIITGIAKGMKLTAPHGLSVRPTTDRVKESIFNILSSKIVDSQVLDLFSGTGNLGLEAVSRGAAQAVLVDKSPTSIAAIKKNARNTKLIENTEIIKLDVLTAINQLTAVNRQFDLIFCDPPYNQGFVQAVLQKVNEKAQLLSDNGVLIMEHSGHEEVSVGDSLIILRTQRYGETMVTFVGKILK